METLTPKEVSKILKLHPFTVKRLAREGKLPGFKIGGVWRFNKSRFVELLNQDTRRLKQGKAQSLPLRTRDGRRK